MSNQVRLREAATLKSLAGLVIVAVLMSLAWECAEVSQSPPALHGVDCIVYSWRTGGHRYTLCLAGLSVGGMVS